MLARCAQGWASRLLPRVLLLTWRRLKTYHSGVFRRLTMSLPDTIVAMGGAMPGTKAGDMPGEMAGTNSLARGR